jgi:aerobic-type carbon monoxide dehydrogenase small subunit (CoxS/CutS family)
MDEKDKKPKAEEEKGAGTMTVSRRGFLKGMGTSTVTVALTGVPFALPPEAMGAPPAGVREAIVQLKVNASAYRLKVKSHWTLLDVLRREIGLTGTKKACNRSSCGVCTVIVDGQTAYSCSLLAIEMEGKQIMTVEGLAAGDKLDPVQQAFSEYGGYQCGYCTSGQMLSAKALLDKNPQPDRDEVREAMAGNICRCGAYPKIVESVLGAAAKERSGP